jgi:tetratricopeptide (TPR) repeat protein
MVKAETAERYARTSDLLAADVGQRIRAARLERGMSLAQLGGEDLSRSFLSLVELGRSRISLRALAIVAERLDRPIAYFLAGDMMSREVAAELLINDAETAILNGQAEEALQILEPLEPAERLRGRTFWLRGWALSQLGRTGEAIPLLRDAVPLAERNKDTRLSVEVRYRLAVALYTAQSYHEVAACLETALELAAQVGDPLLTGKLTIMRGHLASVQRNPDRAVNEYGTARSQFESIHDAGVLAKVYSTLSNTYRDAANPQDALRYSRMALGIVEARYYEHEVGEEINSLAQRYEELGRLKEALATARSAVERAHQAGDAGLEAVARGTLASILLKLDQIDEARSEAEIAGNLPVEGSEMGGIAAWIVLAKIAERESDHGRADELFTRALEALDRGNHPQLYADTAFTYGQALLARGDGERAARYALKAAEIRTSRGQSAAPFAG